MTDPPSDAKRTRGLLRLSLMGMAALFSWLGLWRLLMPIDLVAVAAALVGGYPVYMETFHSLKRKRISMEVSMTLAVAASLATGQFTVSVVISFFAVLAEYIEAYAVGKGRQAIFTLEKSVPKKALIRRNGTEVEVDPQVLALGDSVIVRDGERIPVDGTVVQGWGVVNQAAITGEALRVEKTTGNMVYAGSINESGVLEVRTEKVGKETVFGKIIKLVEEAEGKKSHIQRISDRLATWLVEFALGFGLLTFIITQDVTSTISVIVVTGACGVAAGTPLAIVATVGNLAKKGVIVKGGMYIEEMSRIDTVVIDKTGTLTLGEPVVSDVVSLDGCDQNQILQYAAAAERHSNHPIARAICGKVVELGIAVPPTSDYQYLAGKGVVSEFEGEQVVVGSSLLLVERNVELPREVETSISTKIAQGKTTVLVAHGSKICGLIAVSDSVRAESKEAVADLKRRKIRTIMLTGDNHFAARTVGEEVGMDEVYAELLPQDKVSMVERLVADGHRVVMVGDGINDAPALARANVGIGMGAGTDVAIEEADIVLMTNDLRKVSDVIRVSKRALRTIMVNFYGTVLIDALGVALAFFGFLDPLLAAGIHIVSELVFILNSAKLIR